MNEQLAASQQLGLALTNLFIRGQEQAQQQANVDETLARRALEFDAEQAQQDEELAQRATQFQQEQQRLSQQHADYLQMQRELPGIRTDEEMRLLREQTAFKDEQEEARRKRSKESAWAQKQRATLREEKSKILTQTHLPPEVRDYALADIQTRLDALPPESETTGLDIFEESTFDIGKHLGLPFSLPLRMGENGPEGMRNFESEFFVKAQLAQAGRITWEQALGIDKGKQEEQGDPVTAERQKWYDATGGKMRVPVFQEVTNPDGTKENVQVGDREATMGEVEAAWKKRQEFVFGSAPPAALAPSAPSGPQVRPVTMESQPVDTGAVLRQADAELRGMAGDPSINGGMERMMTPPAVPPMVTSIEDYKLVPEGTIYIDPEGERRRKPKAQPPKKETPKEEAPKKETPKKATKPVEPEKPKSKSFHDRVQEILYGNPYDRPSLVPKGKN